MSRRPAYWMPARASIRNRPTSELVNVARRASVFCRCLVTLVLDSGSHSSRWRVHSRRAYPRQEEAPPLLAVIWFAGMWILPVIALTEGTVVVVFGPGVVGAADLGQRHAPKE